MLKAIPLSPLSATMYTSPPRPPSPPVGRFFPGVNTDLEGRVYGIKVSVGSEYEKENSIVIGIY